MSGMDVLLQMATATVRERHQVLLLAEHELAVTAARIEGLRTERARLDAEERQRRSDPERGLDFALLHQMTLLERALSRAEQQQGEHRALVEARRQECVEARQQESVLGRLVERRRRRRLTFLEGRERRELDEAGLQSYRRATGERRH